MSSPDDKAQKHSLPADPMSPMQEAFANAHEIFETNHSSGFTARQALWLVGCMMTGNPGSPPDGTPDPPDPS